MKRIISMGIVSLLCICSCVPVFANENGNLELQLNQSVYSKGQEVVLSAKLKRDTAVFPNGEVLLTVTQVNNQKIVFVKQALTDENGVCTIRFNLGNEMKSGNYSIHAAGLGSTAESNFQIAGGGPSSSPLTTDKPLYKVGETVSIKGKLVVDGKVLSDHNALIKIYSGGQLVCLKELIADEAGEVVWDYVPSNAIGMHNIQLTVLGNTFNQSFEVVKGSMERMQYQIDGSTNKTIFKGGEQLKIQGTALTLKDGIKKLQGPIQVNLVSKGKVIVSKPVFVASDGKFYTEIKLENKTADYEVILMNQSAVKSIQISVTKQKWF